MNTLAATSQRIPRPVLYGLAVLVSFFVALMVVRVGVLGGSSSSTATPATAAPAATPDKTTATPAANATPKVVLLPNLPSPVARALRNSKVVVVSVYFGQAVGDRAAAVAAKAGARQAGAGFVAVNVGTDKNAAAFSSFTGAVTPPTLLVVRRPGKIITQIPGQVESDVVAQAARNAGARR